MRGGGVMLGIFGVPEQGGRGSAVVRFWLLVLSGLVALGAVSATASAAGGGRFIGRPGGVMPMHGHLAPGQTRPVLRPANAPVTCPALDANGNPTPSPSCNMTYHNGPVLHTNNTHVIYWE